ncbi:hypothetical protein F5Y18DRAFT_398721 [Xylariaceae sp. FL1019]|nr:hypothetical protein F5Y18DRAFT_398721 [Xylariaceae sp. FL1019]
MRQGLMMVLGMCRSFSFESESRRVPPLRRCGLDSGCKISISGAVSVVQLLVTLSPKFEHSKGHGPVKSGNPSTRPSVAVVEENYQAVDVRHLSATSAVLIPILAFGQVDGLVETGMDAQGRRIMLAELRNRLVVRPFRTRQKVALVGDIAGRIAVKRKEGKKCLPFDQIKLVKTEIFCHLF